VGLALYVVSRVMPLAHQAVEIGPRDGWCEAIGRLMPGSELVLRPGDYPGPCMISRGGLASAPIVIRGKYGEDLPRVVYEGSKAHALEIRASYVTVRGVAFAPTAPAVDAIRIVDGHDITIEDNVFSHIGGIVLTVNHVTTHDIIVRRNRIADSRSTVMYFGRHDGRACVVSGLLIEGNYIHGVSAADNEIGYGIQIKLNSTAIIRDNVIVDTKGPGIMVYGADDPMRLTLVERNFVGGSRTSSAIVVGGGPVLVRNNIVVSSAEGGIGLEDYGGRGLLRGIVAAHNTVYDNAAGGIVARRVVALDAKVLNNAVHARAGTPALPANLGVDRVGNVVCTTTRRCFRDPSRRDFSLVGFPSGSILDGPWRPIDDYFGQCRGIPPMAGAIEYPAAAIRLERKQVR